MKSLSRDITLTLVIKLLLLVLLWWFCVRDMRPILSTSQDWLLGTVDHSSLDPKQMINKP